MTTKGLPTLSGILVLRHRTDLNLFWFDEAKLESKAQIQITTLQTNNHKSSDS